MARRSLLFTPGDRPEMLRKAPRSGADVLVFDLEDAVPPARRDEGRESIVEVLSDPEFSPDAEVCVRINAGDVGARDLAALGRGAGGPDAIMIPKVTSPWDVDWADSRIREQLDDELPIFVLLERATGIERAPEIAAKDATDALVFGAEDLSADIGATVSGDVSEVSYARQRVVLAAAIGGVGAIDTVYTDIADREGLSQSAETAQRLGFVGKLAIHPSQVEPIMEAFTPSAEELEWARRILDAGDADPEGVYVVDGEMVDAPIRAQAARILRQAGEEPPETA